MIALLLLVWHPSTVAEKKHGGWGSAVEVLLSAMDGKRLNLPQVHSVCERVTWKMCCRWSG